MQINEFVITIFFIILVGNFFLIRHFLRSIKKVSEDMHKYQNKILDDINEMEKNVVVSGVQLNALALSVDRLERRFYPVTISSVPSVAPLKRGRKPKQLEDRPSS